MSLIPELDINNGAGLISDYTTKQLEDIIK